METPKQPDFALQTQLCCGRVEAQLPTEDTSLNTPELSNQTGVATLADLAAAHQLERFAVVLEGMGLFPRVYPGSLLVCDTIREAVPGDIVLAQVPPGGPVQALVLNGDGDLTAVRSFVPFDGGWGYQLVATVVEIHPPTK
jgi:hypothetical protein